jgi:ppGpp synthetase/RelA/SpoT-type nucleotidyltranferase
MNFEDYRLDQRARYADFVEAIRHILMAAVKAQGMAPHAITGRAKEPDSLAKKLKERGIDPASAIEKQIKDLAGARVVFLTNAQVERFLGASLIRDNFEVLDVNVHYPVPGTPTETKLFNSTNYHVALKPERLALPEYALFDGLKAEIQVQTLLNHAWSEMSHDTFYKEPEFRHVERAQFNLIKERMDTVMRDHLLPAGHDFDKIGRDFSLLLKADEDFEPTVERIKSSTNNDELIDAIGALEDIILPRLADRAAHFVKLVPSLMAAVERTRGAPPGKIETVVGDYEGESGEAVARKLSELLDHYRYCDPELTFHILVRMYSGAESETEQRVWLDVGDRFAEHDLDVWRLHGPAVQRIIVDRIAGLQQEVTAKAVPLLLSMLKQTLSAEVGGTSRGTFQTIVIHQGAVGPSKMLEAVRADAITVLERMLDAADDDTARTTVLDALRKASRPPFNGGNEALRTMVMRDAARVARIERALVEQSGLELRRQMEVRALNVHYWFQTVPPDMAGDTDLVAAQQTLVGELLELRDHLNSDPDFVLYKTLVGHDTVRPGAWDGDPFDYQATDAWREERFPAILAEIDEETAEDWIARLRRYVGEPIASGNGMPTNTFATRLSKEKPGVAIQLLLAIDDSLAPLLLSLIIGLTQAGQRETVLGFAADWLVQDRFLGDLAHWLGSEEVPDAELLTRVGARAIAATDDRAVLAAANAAAGLYVKGEDRRLIDHVFMPAVAYFTERKLAGWLRDAWDVRRGKLVSALDEAEARKLLQSFVDAPSVEYDTEQILKLVAERFPAAVLDFFETRVCRDRGDKAGRFDAIPYRSNELQIPLAQHPVLLVAATRRWYDREPHLHQFRGGRLVCNTFPAPTAEITAALGEFIARGSSDDLDFVLKTLQPYEGDGQIYPICMDIVDRLEPGDEMLRRVAIVLGETGVVSGEFGFVEAETEQHARLKAWLDDPRPKVKAFAEAQMRRAEQSMAWEQRRAQTDVEQMKRDWGGPAPEEPA